MARGHDFLKQPAEVAPSTIFEGHRQRKLLYSSSSPRLLVGLVAVFDTETTMSSRDGPRVSGTDGRDFQHREKVANHYKIRSVCRATCSETRSDAVSVMSCPDSATQLICEAMLCVAMPCDLSYLSGVKPANIDLHVIMYVWLSIHGHL